MKTNKMNWLAILGISAVVAAMSMSFIMLNTGLPSIQQAFQAEMIELQWIINLYGIVISSCLLFMGYLGDLLGYKKVYLFGSIALGICMLGGALSPNVGTLIFFQIFYGLAGAVILPVSQALLRNLFPENQIGTAMGIFMATTGIFFSVGPLIGGRIIHHFGWQSIFWANLLMTIIGIILTLLFVPSSVDQKKLTKTIDAKSAALFIVSVGLFTLAIIQSNVWNMTLIIPLFLISIIGLGSLILWEVKSGKTILQRELFSNRVFSIASFSNFSMICFLWSTLFLIPLYVQNVLGYDVIKTGLLMFFYSIPIAILSPITGKIYNRIGARLLLILGFIFLIVGSFIAIVFHEATSFYLVAFSALLMGIGIGTISTPSAAAAVSVLPKHETGLASGTFLTIQEIGGSVGLAVVVTFVRFHADFLQGYKNGMLLLSFISLVSMCIMFFLPKRVSSKSN